MSIVPRLAASMNRRDEAPNIELAKDLVKANDVIAIAELVELTQTAKKPIRYNAIKALYEIGEIAPSLLLPHQNGLVQLLADNDNRILWGSIQALDLITPLNPQFIVTNLNAILDAADRSSVIAKDRAIAILVKLNANEEYAPMVTPVLLNRIAHARPNQFPTYVEKALTTLGSEHFAVLVAIIQRRKNAIPGTAKQKRLNKILKNL